MGVAKNDNYPFEGGKFTQLFTSNDDNNKFLIAFGIDKISKKTIIAFRYDDDTKFDNITENARCNYNVGYPYRYCEYCNNKCNNKKVKRNPTKIWVKIPDEVCEDFLDLLPKIKLYGKVLDKDIEQCKNDIKNEKNSEFDIEQDNKENSKKSKFDIGSINEFSDELFKDKFVVIFENDELQISIGINKFNKKYNELIVAFRWLIDISSSNDEKGYPYQWCENEDCENNQKLVKVWLPLPNYLALDFIDILSKKFENKADFKIKSVVENS